MVQALHLLSEAVIEEGPVKDRRELQGHSEESLIILAFGSRLIKENVP